MDILKEIEKTFPHEIIYVGMSDPNFDLTGDYTPKEFEDKLAHEDGRAINVDDPLWPEAVLAVMKQGIDVKLRFMHAGTRANDLKIGRAHV